MASKHSVEAKVTAQDVTKIRAALQAKGAKTTDLDALTGGKAGKASRKEMIDDLIVWLRSRPKAKK